MSIIGEGSGPPLFLYSSCESQVYYLSHHTDNQPDDSMKKNRLSRFILVSAACMVLGAAVFFSQRHLDSRFGTDPSGEDFKYLPSGTFLKGAALSYDEMAADLLWIKTVAYFGGHAKTDLDYTWLYHLLDITTTLDPLFSDPYEFGGIVLAVELGDVDKSIAILNKGMANVPTQHKRYWYLPFFNAFNYMYYKGDNLRAARYLEIAAQSPHSPAYLPLLVARLYARSDDPGLAISFLEEMLRSTDSPELQEKLQRRIRELMVERDIRFLEQGRDQFLAQTGRYPNTLAELVENGFIKNIPPEPFGGTYLLAPEDHSIRSSMTERLQLHINKAGSLVNKSK